jgi:hypothetical protein
MRLFLTTFFTLLSISLFSITLQSSGNGIWDDPTTWRPSSVPQNGDTIIIESGDIITVNCNCGVYTDLTVLVYGRLYYNNGKKLRMDGASNVLVYGSMGGGNGGSKLIIGGNTVFDGNDPDITNNSLCDLSGCASDPLPIELAYFKVENIDNKAYVKWETLSEINIDYFIIEKSHDSELWISYETISGHNKPAKYQIIDDPRMDIYYRLVECDLDGNYHNYNIIRFNYKEDISEVIRVVDLNGNITDLNTPGFKIIIYTDRVEKIYNP